MRPERGDVDGGEAAATSPASRNEQARAPRSRASRGRRVLALGVKLALAVLVLGLVARSVDGSRFWESMRGASPALLAAALLAFVGDDLIVTHKWRLLLDGLAVRVPFFRLFKVYLKGRFIGFFIPSSVSADLYKGAVLTRDTGTGKAVASSIVMERLLGLVSIATISAVAVGALPSTLLGVSSGATVAFAVLATVGGLGVFLHADRIATVTLPLLPARWTRLASFLRDLAAAFAAYRSRGRLLVETFLLSLLIQAARSAGVFLLARAVDDGTAFHYFLLLVPYLYIVNLLPFASSRVGLEQGVFIVMFGAVGMDAETALAVSLLSVAGSFVAALPGGAWLLAAR